jgi:uncharacterized protein (TIGR03118 family)
MRRLQSVLLGAFVGLGLTASIANATVLPPYSQTNLVSNLALPGVVQDPNLQNPWGVSESATSPLWISDQAAGVATLYTLNGLTATPAGGPLVVTIPALPTPPNGPTGQVNNSIGGVATNSFMITQSGTLAPAHFIFANLNGTISAWTAQPPAAAQIQVTTPGATYTGLAIGGTVSVPFLYAANGAQNRIDVFDGTFTNVNGTPQFAGKFANPFSSDGLVPFNVQNIGGDIYVTYAPATIGANRTPQTMATAGQGAVAEFDTNGNLLRTVINFDQIGSHLASPWGIALAPAGFGPFGGDLLVGNFSYSLGEIDAYNPVTGAFLGTLDSNAAWQGLWALTFGSGSASGGSSDILYFTTGLNAETNGLFAALSVAPEPSTLALLGAGLLSLYAWRRRSSRRRDEAAG